MGKVHMVSWERVYIQHKYLTNPLIIYYRICQMYISNKLASISIVEYLFNALKVIEM